MSLVSFYTNSFNRLPLLQNLLRSFEQCNIHPNVEWIITDYGSTDGSRDFLRAYQEKANFPVKLIIASETEYFNQIKISNLDRRAKFEAILRKYRNDALRVAGGELIFDIATDHQFIRRGDWVKEIADIFNHRQQTTGRQDLSGIIHFGYFRWRLDKKNNLRGEEQNTSDSPYFVAKEKAYVDYMAMQKEVINDVGLYLELTQFEPGSLLMDRWDSKDDTVRPESEYCIRCEQRGLSRAFMKYPILASFKNSDVEALKRKAGRIQKTDQLLIPLWTLEELKKYYGHLDRPLSSEELRINKLARRWLGLIPRKYQTTYASLTN